VIMLNHYAIYWIKEEFAHFFYYRSDILCRFIKSYYRYQNREDLKKQFQYITVDMPQNLLIAHIMKHQPAHISIKNEDGFLHLHEEIGRASCRESITRREWSE